MESESKLIDEYALSDINGNIKEKKKKKSNWRGWNRRGRGAHRTRDGSYSQHLINNDTDVNVLEMSMSEKENVSQQPSQEILFGNENNVSVVAESIESSDNASYKIEKKKKSNWRGWYTRGRGAHRTRGGSYSQHLINKDTDVNVLEMSENKNMSQQPSQEILFRNENNVSVVAESIESSDNARNKIEKKKKSQWRGWYRRGRGTNRERGGSNSQEFIKSDNGAVKNFDSSGNEKVLQCWPSQEMQSGDGNIVIANIDNVENDVQGRPCRGRWQKENRGRQRWRKNDKNQSSECETDSNSQEVHFQKMKKLSMRGRGGFSGRGKGNISQNENFHSDQNITWKIVKDLDQAKCQCREPLSEDFRYGNRDKENENTISSTRLQYRIRSAACTKNSDNIVCEHENEKCLPSKNINNATKDSAESQNDFTANQQNCFPKSKRNRKRKNQKKKQNKNEIQDDKLGMPNENLKDKQNISILNDKKKETETKITFQTSDIISADTHHIPDISFSQWFGQNWLETAKGGMPSSHFPVVTQSSVTREDSSQYHDGSEKKTRISLQDLFSKASLITNKSPFDDQASLLSIKSSVKDNPEATLSLVSPEAIGSQKEIIKHSHLPALETTSDIIQGDDYKKVNLAVNSSISPLVSRTIITSINTPKPNTPMPTSTATMTTIKPKTSMTTGAGAMITTKPNTSVPTSAATMITTKPNMSVPTSATVMIPTKPNISVPTGAATMITTKPNTSVPTSAATMITTKPNTSVPTSAATMTTIKPNTSMTTSAGAMITTKPNISVPTSAATMITIKPNTSVPTSAATMTTIKPNTSMTTGSGAMITTKPNTSVPTSAATMITTKPNTPVHTSAATMITTKPNMSVPTSATVMIPTKPNISVPTGAATMITTKPNTSVPTSAATMITTKPNTSVPTSAATMTTIKPNTSMTTGSGAMITTKPNTSVPTSAATMITTKPNTPVPTSAATLTTIKPNTTMTTGAGAMITTKPNMSVPTSAGAMITTKPNTSVPTSAATMITTKPNVSVPTSATVMIPTKPNISVPTGAATMITTKPNTSVPISAATMITTKPNTSVPTSAATMTTIKPNTSMTTSAGAMITTKPNTSVPTSAATMITTKPNTPVPTSAATMTTIKPNTSMTTGAGAMITTKPNTPVPTSTATLTTIKPNTSMTTGAGAMITTKPNISVPTSAAAMIPTKPNTSVPTSAATMITTKPNTSLTTSVASKVKKSHTYKEAKYRLSLIPPEDTRRSGLCSKLEFYVSQHCKLVIKSYGDIAKEKSDLLVSLLGPEVDMKRTKVGQSFNREFPFLMEELNFYHKRNPYSKVLTIMNPIGSNCKAICHVILTPWDQENSQDQIETALDNIFNVARQLNIKSISIPPLGCGQAFRFPVNCMVEWLLKYIAHLKIEGELHKIVIVAPDSKLFHEFRQQGPFYFGYAVSDCLEDESLQIDKITCYLTLSQSPKRGTVDFMQFLAEQNNIFPSYWNNKEPSVFTLGGSIKNFVSNLIWRPKIVEAKLVDVDDETHAAIRKLVMETLDTSVIGHGADATNMYYSSIKVTSIQRVENQVLFEKYHKRRKVLLEKMIKKGFLCKDIGKITGSKGKLLTKKLLSDAMGKELYSEINETYLFHGTKENAISSIIENGFDPNCSKPAAMFGQGIYAAEKFTKADQYTDNKTLRTPNGTNLTLILTRMLLGNVFICDENHKLVIQKVGRKFKKPPCMNCLEDLCHCLNTDHYDSLMADGKWLFREFIVYESSQCYPEYLITYQRM